MPDSENITFRRLQEDDLELMHEWLNESHVHEWYEKDEDNSLEQVKKRYFRKTTGKELTEAYIISYEGKPIGYIQTASINGWDEFLKITGYDDSTFGVDMFVGDPTFIGFGVGTISLKKFLKEIVFSKPGITTCIIDPEVNNKRAIRSYEKAGFKHVTTFQLPSEKDPTYLMEIKKEDL